YRNRAYHPGLGRFLSEDPAAAAAGDLNLFRYCDGDPVNKKDPNGTDVIVATYDIPGPFDHIGIGIYSGNPQTSQTWGFNPVSASLGGLAVGRDYRVQFSPSTATRSSLKKGPEEVGALNKLFPGEPAADAEDVGGLNGGI